MEDVASRADAPCAGLFGDVGVVCWPMLGRDEEVGRSLVSKCAKRDVEHSSVLSGSPCGALRVAPCSPGRPGWQHWDGTGGNRPAVVCWKRDAFRAGSRHRA